MPLIAIVRGRHAGVTAVDQPLNRLQKETARPGGREKERGSLGPDVRYVKTI